MNGFQPGDRIRVELVDDDGLPMVRYGFVGAVPEGRPVVGIPVLLDGELNGSTIIDRSCIHQVTITTVELCLDGTDLLHDPSLRQGLVNLWLAEAEDAGLDIDAIHPVGTGVRDSSEGFVMAELTAAGEHYVLRATSHPNRPDTVAVRADRPNRWEL